MRQPHCTGCGQVVLALEGQFEHLDSYHVDGDRPPVGTSGDWHGRCLAESGHGRAWFDARLRHREPIARLVDDRTATAWAVIGEGRGRPTIAYSTAGESLELVIEGGRTRRAPDGGVYRRDELHHLELADREPIAHIQDALESDGSFPLPALIDLLGIGERVRHDHVLADGRVHLDRRGTWTRHVVSMRIVYGVLIPAALEPFVTRRA